MEEIKSQNDLNQPETHSTDVLLSTIEELERTKKQLEIAVDGLERVRNLWLENKPMYSYIAICSGRITKVALEKIKELNKWLMMKRKQYMKP